MENLTLSPRLERLVSLVEPGSVLADVGTDHAYVPVWLLCHGVISRAVATDIHAGPLARAEQVARSFGVREDIRLVLCDGLRGVEPHEADTVVIAGMGGETMISILAGAPWTKQDTRLILQPQSKQPELRAWLWQNGYQITGEHLVRDAGKLYGILTAQGGRAPLPDTAALYGGIPEQHSDPALLRTYLESECAKLLDLAEKLSRSVREEDIRRREEYMEAAAGMRRTLEQMQEV